MDISATSIPAPDTYNIQLKVWLTDNPTVIITNQFEVTFIDACATTATLNFDSLPSEFSGFDYTIGTGTYTVSWSATNVIINNSGGHACSLEWEVTE